MFGHTARARREKGRCLDTQPAETWHLFPAQPAPPFVCCYTQDKWMRQAGRRGGGEESQNSLCLELPHDLFRLLQWASPACP